MTNKEAIQKAVRERDARLAGQWVERMRTIGANYDDCQKRATQLTGISADDWETLMEEADALEASS